MKAKKVFIWVAIFSLLSAYSSQLLQHYDDSPIAEAYAAGWSDDHGEERRLTTFQRIVDRLSLRKASAQERCEDDTGRHSHSSCRRASLLTRLILIFSAHVS